MSVAIEYEKIDIYQKYKNLWLKSIKKRYMI